MSSPNTTMVAAPLRHHQTKEDVQNLMSSLIFTSKIDAVSQVTHGGSGQRVLLRPVEVETEMKLRQSVLESQPVNNL